MMVDPPQKQLGEQRVPAVTWMQSEGLLQDVSYVDVSMVTQPPEETPLELEVDPPDDEPVDPPLLLLPDELPEPPPDPLPEPLEVPPEDPPEDAPEDPPGPTSLVLPPHASNAEAQKRRTAEPRKVRAANVGVMGLLARNPRPVPRSSVWNH